MDVIESGLGNPEDKRDRALFISLTLTSTSTDLMTATVTETVTASCYSPTLSECTTTTTTTTTPTTTTTTTTTAASTGRKRRSPKFDMFMDLVDDVANAKVYKMHSSGEMEMVDISEIMPSPAMGARLDADMVVDA